MIKSDGFRRRTINQPLVALSSVDRIMAPVAAPTDRRLSGSRDVSQSVTMALSEAIPKTDKSISPIDRTMTVPIVKNTRLEESSKRSGIFRAGMPAR